MGKETNIFGVWNTAVCPLSFDIIFYLAFLNILSLESGGDGKFNFLVLKQGFRQVGIEGSYSAHHQERKFRNVILQMLNICNWVKDVQINLSGSIALPAGSIMFPDNGSRKKKVGMPEWQITPMTAIQLEKLYAAGKENTTGFAADEELVHYYKNIFGEKSLVLQLRQSKFFKERNAPIRIFCKVTEDYVKKGYNVFYIPDFENIDGQDALASAGAKKILEATYDYDTRLACSEAASCNVLWCGGVNVPLHFSNANCIWFGLVNNNVQITSLDFFSRKGPTLFKQPPWMLNKGKYLDWTEQKDVSEKHIKKTINEFLDDANI